ncbi:MAG: formyl transferase [Methylotetracoccus sp.]
MNIVILTSKTPSNIWLVNQLLGRHEVSGIIVESPPLAADAATKVERRRSMLRRHGWLKTLNKLAFNWFRSRFLASADATTIAGLVGPGGGYVREVPSVTVPNINDAAAIRFIEAHAPELLVVCGTTVIKPEVFTLAPRGTINIHTGITPEYRSADPIFWALYNGEPEKVGVTVHFVDQGIDTGSIIEQQSVPVFRGDTLASLYVRCVSRGADMMSRAINAIERGAVQTLNRDRVKSRAFYSIDLGLAQYLLFRWRFRRMQRVLPLEPHTDALLEGGA